MVKAVDPLTLRVMEGFAQSLCRLPRIEVPVPDSITLCRSRTSYTPAFAG